MESPKGSKDNSIHLWRVSLDRPDREVQRLKKLLSADELERAQRFYSYREREHYLAARGCLREILSSYIKEEPGEIQFVSGERGKPLLFFCKQQIHFNLSHSGDYALVAVSVDREVGVDLEKLRPLKHADAILERFFSVEERAGIEAGEIFDDRTSRFFRIWSRIEALAKAKGVAVTDIDESLSSILISAEGDIYSAGSWIARDIDPFPGYVGALCTEGRSLHVCYRDFSTGL